MKKEVKKGVKLYAKKRKSEDSSDDDLNAFDLKDFNYDDMDNLKIDSEDEFSVWSEGQNESYKVASVKLEHEQTPHSHTNLDMFALDDVKPTYQDLDKCIDDSRKSDLCPISQLIRGHSKNMKRQKSVHYKPVTFVRFNARRGKGKTVTTVSYTHLTLPTICSV